MLMVKSFFLRHLTWANPVQIFTVFQFQSILETLWMAKQEPKGTQPSLCAGTGLSRGQQTLGCHRHPEILQVQHLPQRWPEQKCWNWSTKDSVGRGKPQSMPALVSRTVIWEKLKAFSFIMWSLMNICTCQNFPVCERCAPLFSFLTNHSSPMTKKKNKISFFTVTQNKRVMQPLELHSSHLLPTFSDKIFI